ncbi:MAG: hypothetical protein V4558_08600 [Gemmatimonadota bacterium]
MSWRARLPAPAPFLAAWYLALSLLGEFATTRERWLDVVGTLLLATLTAALAWLIGKLLRRDRPRATMIAVILVLWFALFGTVRLLLTPHLRPPWTSAGLLLLCWSIPMVVGVVLTMRTPTISTGAIRGMNTALSVLILMAAFTLLRPREPEAVPPPTSVLGHRAGGRPDIYIIIVDKLSSVRTFDESYHISLHPFADSLRALGFVVPERARTNYVQTQLSLASMLNWSYLPPLINADAPKPWERTRELIENAKAWAFLQALGYRFAFFPTGFPGTNHNRHAQLNLESPVAPVVTLGQTWIRNSPFEPLWGRTCGSANCATASNFPYPVESPEALRWKLETVATLPDSAGPIVAFLHFLGTHEPYVFDGQCKDRTAWWPKTDVGDDSLEVREAYAAQAECSTRLVLASVREILKRSRVRPVIIIQADHGHGRIGMTPLLGNSIAPTDATELQRRERLGVFAAYLFPGAAEAVYDTITPVNVLPMAFNSVFGTSLPQQPDRSWWSTWQQPVNFTEMRWIGDSIATVSTRSTVRRTAQVASRPPSDND